jgi:hypothetical protein
VAFGELLLSSLFYWATFSLFNGNFLPAFVEDLALYHIDYITFFEEGFKI